MTAEYHAAEDGDDLLMQENEITALESIYPQDFSYTQHPPNSPALYTGTLSVAPTLPSPEVVVRVPPSDSTPAIDLSLSYLPPVTVRFAMPHGYPSRHALECTMECLWIERAQLERLEGRVGEVWEEERDVVLFAVAEFLQNEALAFLGITFPLELQITHHGLTPLPTLLTHHDSAFRLHSFSTTTFSCALCLDNKKGTACVRLSTCDHVFCHPCLSSYFSMLIREGMVSQVRCPDLDCSRKSRVARGEDDADPPPPSHCDLAAIVGTDLANRYDRLVAKQRDEADPMVIFCPRLQCGRAVRKDPENIKLCLCDSCGFAFCLFCQRTWHGPAVYCQLKNKVKIVQDWLSAETEEVRRMLEFKYGAKNIDRLLRDYELEQETEKWKRENTMPCPQCGVHVIKSYGCNHMTCQICKSHFCYLCGQPISAGNPYAHFNKAGTSCHMRLFEGVDTGEIPEDEH